MRQWIRSHLTYANVMATLAVFLVLGGGAYAAFHLPKNSVRSKNIVNGQAKRPDLGANAVNSAKVANGSLRLADIVVAQDTRTIDPGSLLANQCGVINVGGGPFSRVKTGDVTLAVPESLHSGVIAYGDLIANPGQAAQGARLTVCNTQDIAFNEDPTLFKVIVLR